MSGADLISAERRRQIDVEGWTPEHDAEHAGEVLAVAACCYALPPTMRRWKKVPVEFRASGRWEAITTKVPTLWPWDGRSWKPTRDDRVRELVKAGGLIAAEIDRLTARSPAVTAAPDPYAELASGAYVAFETALMDHFHGSVEHPYTAPGHNQNALDCWHCEEAAVVAAGVASADCGTSGGAA